MLHSECRRRWDELGSRIAWLDEHGTRGVEVIRVQLLEQAKDLGAIGSTCDTLAAKLDEQTSSKWARFAAYAIAIIPLYVLLFLAVFAHAPGK